MSITATAPPAHPLYLPPILYKQGPLPDPVPWPLERGNVFLVGLERGMCKLPVGADTGYMQMFCGRTVIAGPYCERCGTERVKGKPGRTISVPE